MAKNIAERNTALILNGNLIKAILYLSIPIVINNFIQTMYNLTDAYWLGKLGTADMAGISLVSPVQNMIINFGQGITLAGSILISQYIGANDSKNARSMASQIFTCSMIFSIVLGTICFFCTPGIVTWLGAEGDVFQRGKTYLQIVIFDLPFLFIINIFTAVSQAQGNTVRPMFLNLLGIVFNMVLDPLFMMVLDLGIAGAAFATVLAKIPCAAVGLYFLTRKENEVHLEFKNFKFEKSKLLNIVRIGLPTAIGGSTMQFGFLLMTKNVLEFGDDAMAAYGIGNRINGIITMPSNAVGSAVATIVGQNIGAENIERAEAAYKKARIMIVAFLFVSGMIMSRGIVSTFMASIFSEDSNVILMAADFLSIMAFWCWANGIHNTTTGLFQGTGNTLYTMVIEAARLWVFRFASLFILKNVFGMAERSVWFSVVISNGISAFILWVLYKMGLWRKNKAKL